MLAVHGMMISGKKYKFRKHKMCRHIMVIHSQMRLLSVFLQQMSETEDINICCLMLSEQRVLKYKMNFVDTMLVERQRKRKETSYVDHQMMLQRESE